MGTGRYAPREQGALELGLDEELAIEQIRGRVENQLPMRWVLPRFVATCILSSFQPLPA